MFSCRSGNLEALPALGAQETAIRFDATGQFLYVASRVEGIRRVERLELDSGKRTPWRTLDPPDPTGVVYSGDPAVSADGSSVAYSYFRHVADLYLAEGIA